MMSINLATQAWAKEKNIPWSYFPEIPSTNDVAKNEFQNTQEDFKIFLADHQTSGKGRNQSVWQNLSNGEILLSTWCFRTHFQPQPILTPLLGLALYKSLLAWAPQLSNLRLKAPNDLYLDNGKLSGLLVEVAQKGNVSEIFVGLGLNVFASPSIDQPTRCLADQLEAPQNFWNRFCDLLVIHFQEAVASGVEKALTSTQQNELLEALNNGLPDDQKFLKVSPSCDLTTKSGTTSWVDL